MARNGRKRADQTAESNGATALAEPPTATTNGSPIASDAIPQNAESGESRNRPAMTFSYPVTSGVYIVSSAWAREIVHDGRMITVYSVTCRKNYWDEPSNCWKNTTFFRSSELHIARHALLRAEEWCLDQRVSQEPPF